MDRKREIESYFSWVPPPSTVIIVRSADNQSPKSKWSEKLRTDNELLNERKIVSKQPKHRSRDRSLFNESHLKENEVALPQPYSEISSIDLKRECEEDGYNNESANPDKAPELIFEEHVEAESVQVAESGINWLADEQVESRVMAEDHPMSSLPAQEPTRKGSGSEHYRVGREAVNVGNLMKSRKKSEFNPSQKFLSFSFQNDGDFDEEDNRGSLSDLGAVYLKRLDPDTSEKLGRQEKIKAENIKDKKEKNKRKSKKEEEKLGKGLMKSHDGRKNKLLVEEEPAHGNDFGRNEAPLNRKISAFIQEDVDNGPIDVQDILSRKKSTDSFKEKFLSMSFEKNSGQRACDEPVPYPTTPHGGFYAKRVSNKL